jgi:hypothetical protein
MSLYDDFFLIVVICFSWVFWYSFGYAIGKSEATRKKGEMKA